MVRRRPPPQPVPRPLRQALRDAVGAFQDGSLCLPAGEECTLETDAFFWSAFGHDAFLPERGFEPPPWDEIQRNLDLEFWEALGEEEAATQSPPLLMLSVC